MKIHKKNYKNKIKYFAYMTTQLLMNNYVGTYCIPANKLKITHIIQSITSLLKILQNDILSLWWILNLCTTPTFNLYMQIKKVNFRAKKMVNEKNAPKKNNIYIKYVKPVYKA